MANLLCKLTNFLKQPSRMVSRNSQQRGREGGGPAPQRGGGRGGQGKIIVIPSTTREPKLKTVENAWKPSPKENTQGPDDMQARLPHYI